MKKLLGLVLSISMVPSFVTPQTFVVTNTLDSGPFVPIAGSLRSAITSANVAGGTIKFNIPGTGVQTITPQLDPFEGLQDNVIIDGTSQPGYAGMPLIEVTGANAAITMDGSGNTINALTFNNIPSSPGITIVGLGSNNTIKNCFIGTNATGTAASPVNSCILIAGGSGAIIENNLLSGATTDAIGINDLFLSPITNTVIQNNLIGVNAADNAAIPNNVGIAVVISTTSIVSNLSILNNVISANTTQGILFTVTNTSPTGIVIQGNHIGSDATNTLVLGNGSDGIQVNATPSGQATNMLIGGTSSGQANFIAFNGGSGVTVNGAELNSILTNPDFDNGSNGITFQNGGNHGQGFPTITSALQCISDNNLFLDITAPAVPVASTFRLEVFDNLADRTPITEGQFFIAATNGISSGSSTELVIPGSFLGTFVSGTATNTNGAGGTLGDTSTFSPNFKVSSEDLIVSITPSPETLCPGQPKILTTTISGGIGTTFKLTWPDLTQNPVGSTSTRSVSVPGTYTATAEDLTTHCTGSSTVQVVPEITVTLAPLTQTICTGKPATLIATVNGGTPPYTATLNDGTVATGNSPLTFMVTPTTSANFQVTSLVDSSSPTCSIFTPSNQVTVTVDTPSITLSANHPLICAGQSVTLSAAVTGDAPFTVVFKQDLTTIGTVTSATSPITLTVTPDFTANYLAILTDASGCTITSDPITVTVSHVGPIELVTNKNTIIVGQSATLTAFFEGTRTLFWSDGTVNENVTSPFKHKVRPKVTTTFTVTDENADGCKSTSNPVTITVKPIAVHLDPVKKCPCPDECVTIFGTIKAGTPPFRLSWSDGKTFKIHSRKIRRQFCTAKTTSLTVTVTDSHHNSATSNKIKVKRCKAKT